MSRSRPEPAATLAVFTAVVAVFACAAAPARPAGPTTAPAADEPNEVRLSTGRDGEYDELLNDAGLDAAARARVERRLAERRQRLEAFAAGEQGRRLIELRTDLADARRAGRDEAVGPLRARIKPLADAYWRARVESRQAILRELSADQLDRYAAVVLRGRVAASLPADVPDDRRSAAMASSDARAAAWADAGVIADDPFFATLKPLEDEIVADATSTPVGR